MSGFERDADGLARGAVTLIVCPELGQQSRDAEARIAEARGLAAAIGLDVVEAVAEAFCAFAAIIRQSADKHVNNCFMFNFI